LLTQSNTISFLYCLCSFLFPPSPLGSCQQTGTFSFAFGTFQYLFISCNHLNNNNNKNNTMHCIIFLANVKWLFKHGKVFKTAIVSSSKFRQNPLLRRHNFTLLNSTFFINLSNNHWVADHEHYVNGLLRPTRLSHLCNLCLTSKRLNIFINCF